MSNFETIVTAIRNSLYKKDIEKEQYFSIMERIKNFSDEQKESFVSQYKGRSKSEKFNFLVDFFQIIPADIIKNPTTIKEDKNVIRKEKRKKDFIIRAPESYGKFKEICDKNNFSERKILDSLLRKFNAKYENIDLSF